MYSISYHIWEWTVSRWYSDDRDGVEATCIWHRDRGTDVRVLRLTNDHRMNAFRNHATTQVQSRPDWVCIHLDVQGLKLKIWWHVLIGYPHSVFQRPAHLICTHNACYFECLFGWRCRHNETYGNQQVLHLPRHFKENCLPKYVLQRSLNILNS